MNDAQAQPSSEARFCTECGRPVHPNARYCGVCGHPIAKPANPVPMASTQLIPVPGLPPTQESNPAPVLPVPVPVASPSIPPPAPVPVPVPMAATQRMPVPGLPSSEEPLRLPVDASPVPPPLAATQRIPVPRPSEEPARLPVGSVELPPMEATQRIPVPVPVRDEHPSLATNPGLSPLPDFRPVAPPQAPVAVPPPAEVPVAITLHSAPEPTPDSTPAPAPAAPRKAPMWPWFLGGMVLMVILVGGFLLLTFRPRGEQRLSPKLPVPAPQATPAPLPASATPGNAPEAPQELKPYLERVAGGDTKAMRMLGAFYTYGLNVPANREEGLRWYRKAAEAGDTTARQELQQLEGKH